MTRDDNKGITSIEYNHLNLPTNIVVSNSDHNGTINYIYDATGNKLKKSVGGSVTLYAGNHVYNGQENNEELQFFNHPEGYVSAENSAYNYVYQYKDHLGNVRLSYMDNGGTLEIVEENNYYPFGLKHKGYNYGGDAALGNDVAQKWKFGGKEYDESLGLENYDFGARNYDPALGRWMNLDPLAEQMRRHSPYNYAFNSPIFFIDPDGMMPFPSAQSLQNLSETIDDIAYLSSINTDNIEPVVLNEVTITSGDEHKENIADRSKTDEFNFFGSELTATTSQEIGVISAPPPLYDELSTSMSVSKTVGNPSGLINSTAELTNNSEFAIGLSTNTGIVDVAISSEIPTDGPGFSGSAQGKILGFGTKTTIGMEDNFRPFISMELSRTIQNVTIGHETKFKPGLGTVAVALIIATEGTAAPVVAPLLAPR